MFGATNMTALRGHARVSGRKDPFKSRQRQCSRFVRCSATTDTVQAASTISAVSIDVALGADNVSKEAPETRLAVEGSIPTWLAGDLYRTGPGMYKDMVHYFDGLGMLVRFSFKDGGVTWSQKFIESDAYLGWKAAGKPAFSEIGYRVPPHTSIINMMKFVLGLGRGMTDNACVSLVPSTTRGQLVAMTEPIVGQFRVDARSLNTLSRVEYRDGIKSITTTAHPCPIGGGWAINIAYGFPSKHISVYKYRVGEEGPREVIASVELSNPRYDTPWIHDLPCSKNHVAVMEMPAYVRIQAMMGLEEAEHVFVNWVPEDGTTVTLVPLTASAKKKVFKLPPFFCFHFSNAFETDIDGLGKCLCIDAAHHASPVAISKLTLEAMRDPDSSMSECVWKRIILPLESDAEPVIEDLVLRHADYGSYAELPCINRAYYGRNYQYAYAGTVDRPAAFINQVTKFDLHSKQVVGHWRPEEGFPLAEPKFVGRPGATAEDDGVVLAPSIGGDGRCMVAVLDARDLSELARCYTPEPFSMGFHTTFVGA